VTGRNIPPQQQDHKEKIPFSPSANEQTEEKNSETG
jgi:hypothetical protein